MADASSRTSGGAAQQAREAAAAPSAKLQQTFEQVKEKLPAIPTGLLSSSEGPRDHELYDTLGIAEDASDAEIRAAFAERKHEVLLCHMPLHVTFYMVSS
jgi:hypothetical protein